MNNYLTSIAARALNPAPQVRPLLGGRLEPATASRERLFDSVETKPSRTKHSELNLEINQSGAEARGQRDSRDQPDQSFDLSSAFDRSQLTRDVHPLVATAATANSDDDAAPTLITKRPSQQTTDQSLRQNMHVEVRPVEKILNVSKNTAPGDTTLLEPPGTNLVRTRLEESPSRSVLLHQQPAEEEAVSRPTRRSSRTIETFPSSVEAEEPRPRFPQSNSRSTPQSGAASNAREDNGSQALPPVVQSSIAPLIETGPEHLYHNRPSIQAQPTVHVTIGRIEVRAVQSSQPPAKSRAGTPVMNLDEYLTRRNQGGAR